MKNIVGFQSHRFLITGILLLLPGAGAILGGHFGPLPFWMVMVGGFLNGACILMLPVLAKYYLVTSEDRSGIDVGSDGG
ncbi:hypothetical protein [Salinibacter ruber]|jgi:hypothetical protein|uniref:Uncharacterized protein n=1 Tax=Salinibacter ruber TaxID=146919 RepID=A0A9X2Q1G5_9BACT|nr:hypothetical protein [Salinibacter ruber]MCS3660087.1 hypothetical protein [Salinibacter ruber]MCS3709772.1 hypothetical protein [Salinibacter ruber]MCS4170400.1 hypothetical protein [Salinibacter ruber]